MAKIIGDVDPRGIYHATELMGRNMVSLQLVDQLPEPDPNVIRIEIPRRLARQVGGAKLEGETLVQALERLVRAGLKV
jgi:hypothetical protein